MTTYKELKGTNIEAVSSDPSNPIEGQVWYNTDSNVLKGNRAALQGSWTVQNTCGGEPQPARAANTELWNGTNWTEVNNLNQNKFGFPGGGSTTSGLVFGGEGTPPFLNYCRFWSSCYITTKS